jgi:3',5'-cyclic AMP phosphodiesterase CpdA
VGRAETTPGEASFWVVSDTHYEAPKEQPDIIEPHCLEVNRRLIETLNHFPGREIPSEFGGGIVTEPRGIIHLGDMIDSGDKGVGALSEARQATEWKAYTEDFGLTGKEGRLRYPVYEVHGNHDSVRENNIVIRSLVERTPKRVGVAAVSPNNLHYAWEWGGVRFIALGIVVGHNKDGMKTGRYAPRESLEFLVDDLARNVGQSGKPVVLIHHIDLLRYSKPCDDQAEGGGEWSACDIAAYRHAISDYNIAAIFHGHLHARRVEKWDGTPRPAAEGIPIFGCKNSGAKGAHRCFFHCTIAGQTMTIREVASRGADGWTPDTIRWEGSWTVPLTRRDT